MAPFSQARVERLICATRVALAASSLFGVWLDPAEPARYADLTYSLHAVYLGYALVLAAIMWRRDSTGRLPPITHAADLLVASVFQYLTLGPSSPFFTYFVFALFSAALRWGWQATVRTAALVLFLFIATGVSLSRTLGPTEFELNRFVIRITYLLVVTVVLVFLGQHEARVREELRRLARWPLAGARDLTEDVSAVLEHAASIVGADRALLIWTDAEEPWFYLASWSASGVRFEKRPPDQFDPLVPEALAKWTFVSPDSTDGPMSLKLSPASYIKTWTGLPVHHALVPELNGKGLASAPIEADRLSGRVFFTDLEVIGAEIMPLVEVVGRELGSSLQQLYSHQERRRLAIAEDRIGVARDLHDGVLQSLTGIRFDLQNIARRARQGTAAQAIEGQLTDLERALAVEQRELRRFIEDLKPSSSTSGRLLLADCLQDIQTRIALEWRASIAIHVNPRDLTVPAVLARAVPLMVHEAIVNALKHGQPSFVSVEVDAHENVLRIAVTDDGRGFGFSGRRDHFALTASHTGPRSLRERVISLGGEISVESHQTGSRVELAVPLGSAYV